MRGRESRDCALVSRNGEVINAGAVWLSPDLDPALRAPVTAAISALLLFEELRKTLPE